jgi:hypothetical protein
MLSSPIIGINSQTPKSYHPTMVKRTANNAFPAYNYYNSMATFISATLGKEFHSRPFALLDTITCRPGNGSTL